MGKFQAKAYVGLQGLRVHALSDLGPPIKY